MASWYDKYNQIGDMPINPTPSKQPQKKKSNDSFLAGLLPTGGGIAGSLGGAAAGAAAGSVIPGIGTAIGGLLGAVLGGAGGSAIGKVGENAIEGNEDLGDGVLQEALLGGVTSTPIGAGLKVARAGVKAATGLGKTGARELIEQAGAQTVGKRTASRLGVTSPAPTASTAVGGDALSTSTSGRMKSAGDKLLLSQYGTISKPFARSSDPAGTISVLADAGITKPVDAERVAAAVTGGNGIITKLTADAVGKTNGVDTRTLKQVFEDAIDNSGIVDKDATSLRQTFAAKMKQLNGGAQGLARMDGKANATDALKVMRDLEKRIANLQGKGDNYRLSTPERVDQASVLQLVRDELDDSIATAGANANLPSLLTPKVRDELIGLMPNNAQWASYVDNNIMGAKSVAELRGSAAPFVRANKIIGEGESNALTAGGRIGNAFAGGNGGVKDMIGSAITGLIKDPAARIAGNTLRGGSGMAAGTEAGRVAGQGIAALSARQGLTRAVLNPMEPEQQDPASLEAMLAAGDPMAMQSQPEMQQPEQATMGYSSAELGSALMAALAKGDTASASVLGDMYKLAAEMEQQSAGSELSQSARTSLATSGNAINTLDQLESLYGGAGGGSGKIGGSVANLTAGLGLNGGVQTYNDLSASSVSQLAKAINGGGQVSDADAAVIVRALPLVTDSPEVAQAKFNALRQRLLVAQQNTVAYGTGGGNDLQSVLAGI